MVGTRTSSTSSSSAATAKTPTNSTQQVFNASLKGAVICNKERISNLEHALEQLIGRVRLLENENCELKVQLKSISDTQATPVQEKTFAQSVTQAANLDGDGDQNSGNNKSDDGGWITVVNKKNNIIKKLWKNKSNFDEHPVRNNSMKKNAN